MVAMTIISVTITDEDDCDAEPDDNDNKWQLNRIETWHKINEKN